MTRVLRICVLTPMALMIAMGSGATLTSEIGAETEIALEIPRPNLSALQPAARRKIETMQSSLDSMLAADDLEALELRESFGFLGQLFHAYQLLDSAQICYRNASSLAPQDARWLYYLGLIYNSKGELDLAIEQYQRALDLGGDRLAGNIRVGTVLLELARTEEAREAFERALEVDPEGAAALFGLGRVEALSGNPERAIDHFEQALELQPEASIIHYPLAQAYRVTGDVELAREHLALQGERGASFPDRLEAILVSIGSQTALEVVADLAKDTEDFSDESFLGFVLSQLGQAPGSEEQLVKLLEKLEASADSTKLQQARVAYGIGGLLVTRGRDEEAIPYFERAVTGDPNLRDASIKLGNALARSSRFEEALAQYDMALASDSRDAVVLSKKATTLVNLDRLEEARTAAEKAIELEPDRSESWKLQGEIQEGLGDIEAAVVSFQSAIEVAPNDEEKMAYHTALGDLFGRHRQFESSAREYLNALRLDEGYVPALERLGKILVTLGYYQQAAVTYRRWVDREPDNVAARFGEATSLILATEHEVARERLEEGLAVLPDSLDLKDLLARHLAACPNRSVRDGQRAVELARELYNAVPTLESMETLAMALAEDGQFDEAIVWQNRLLSEGDEEVDEAAMSRWRANLALYQEKQPCCAGASS